MQIREALCTLRLNVAPATHHHSRTGWVQLDCPWCQSWGKFHLGINEQWLNANCWRCGKHSTYEAVLLLQPDVDRAELVRLLKDARVAGVRDRLVVEPPAPTAVYIEPPNVEPMRAKHRQYLADRGFDPYEIEELWGVRGIGNAPLKWKKLRLAWRLFIPVSVAGTPSTWTTRTVKPGVEPRYLSAPPDCERHSIKTLLYGIEHVGHTALVVEGSTDAWRIGPGTVSTMGTAVSHAQIAALAAVPRRVLVFDNSVAAQRRAHAIACELAVYPGDTLQVQLDGEDPATAPQSEIDELRSAFLS